MSLVLAAAVLSTSAFAQTTFVWNTARPFESAKYSSPDMCLAFVNRTYDSVAHLSSVWRDTLPIAQSQLFQPLPAIVIDRATQCSAHVDPAQVQLAMMLPAMELYLMAGRDADAATVAQRRLAAISDSAVRERAYVLDTLAGVYLSARPVRFAAADPLLAEAVRRGTMRPIEERLSLALSAFGLARSAGDSRRTAQGAQWYIEAFRTGTEADKREAWWTQAARLASGALMIIDADVLRDSLLRGTAGYVKWLQSRWTEVSGEKPGRIPIGQHAPPLVSDIWFPANGASESRPTPGRVSLVVFWDNNSMEGEAQRYARFGDYSALRRLAHQFPMLQITIVSQTVGYFGRQEPPSAGEEARSMQHFWQSVHQIPGAIAVSETRFWNLQQPDGRRIDEPTTNVVNYNFGNGSASLDRGAYLIDTDGTVIYSESLSRESESAYANLIAVLVARMGVEK